METQTLKRFGELPRRSEVQIVRGGVIFRKSAGGPRQTADRQVETRRAILALVESVWRKCQNLRRIGGVAQCQRRGAVDFHVSAAAFLVVKFAVVTESGEHQTVTYPGNRFGIVGQPGNGADRSGQEQKPVRVSKIALGQKLRKERRHHDAG